MSLYSYYRRRQRNAWARKQLEKDIKAFSDWTLSKIKNGIENRTEDEFIDYRVGKTNKTYRIINISTAVTLYTIGIIQMFLNDMGAINLVVSTLGFAFCYLLVFLIKKISLIFYKKQLRKIYKKYGSFQYKI